MFIQTETTADPQVMNFLPGQTVLTSGTATFDDAETAAKSPLAAKLFEIPAVVAVGLGAETVTVTKSDARSWQEMKPSILGVIMEHFVAGLPVLSADDSPGADEPPAFVIEPDNQETQAIVAEVQELIDTRIRPAVNDAGGEVHFRGYRDGGVILELVGAAYSYRVGIENMLRHYIPEFTHVIDHRDMVPKPGMDTPEAKAIQELLDSQINPSVAMHGGHIALVDVKDDTAYIRLEGGCQGCGMADVTLKQGVEGQILTVAPAISRVLDVTDHAGGENPYYQPGK